MAAVAADAEVIEELQPVVLKKKLSNLEKKLKDIEVMESILIRKDPTTEEQAIIDHDAA